MSITYWKPAAKSFALNIEREFIKAAISGDITVISHRDSDRIPTQTLILSLIRACQNHQHAFFKMVSERFREHLTDKIVWESNVFHTTCCKGDSTIIRWMVEYFNMSDIEYKLTPEQSESNFNSITDAIPEFNFSAIFELCKKDDLDLFKYVIDLLPKIEFHKGYLLECAYLSSPSITTYLMSSFKITRDNLSNFADDFLGTLYRIENLDNLRNIIKYFKITFEELRRSGILYTSIRFGNYKIAIWLSSNYSFTRNDLIIPSEYSGPLYKNRDCISHACENNRLDIADWIVVRFKIDAKNFTGLYGGLCVRAHIYQAIYKICANGHLDAVKWYVRKFAIDLYVAHRTTSPQSDRDLVHSPNRNPVRDLDYEVLITSVYNNGHTETLKWLIGFIQKSQQSPLGNSGISKKLIRKLCKNKQLDLIGFIIGIGVFNIKFRIINICAKYNYLNSGQDVVDHAKLTIEDIEHFPHLVPARVG